MGSFREPNPCATRQDYDRFHHHDLAEKGDRELREEYDFLEAHVFALESDDWRRERVQMLEGELARRRVPARGSAGARNASTAAATPKRPIVEVEI